MVSATIRHRPPANAAVADRERLEARNQAVERHLSLAVTVARRYRGRGVPLEDLVQVASIGLIKALDRYDAARNVEFSTFAVPTIAGEIKRYFRDNSWHIKVPRRLQDLAMAAMRARRDLAQTLSRAPTVADLAVHLAVDEADAHAAVRLIDAYRALSLDAPIAHGYDVDLTSLQGGGQIPTSRRPTPG